MTRDTENLVLRTAELAEAARNLALQVDSTVDRILGDVARRSALDLDDLADSLREVEA
jgi:hypothetical protein